MLNVLLAVFVVLLVYFWVCKTSKPKRFPPGPRRYPVIGSVLDMVPPNAIKPELFFGVRHFREKYGSIIGFYLGNERAVVLTNYEDIKEVLSKAETAHRPPIIGLSGRPGKHSAQEVDPELNQDNPPGVILSNVSSFNCKKYVKSQVFAHFRVGIGKSRGVSCLEISEISALANQPWKTLSTTTSKCSLTIYPQELDMPYKLAIH